MNKDSTHIAILIYPQMDEAFSSSLPILKFVNSLNFRYASLADSTLPYFKWQSPDAVKNHQQVL